MPRNEVIEFKVNSDEKARIEERARAAAMNRSAFVRDLALYGGMEIEGVPYETPQETLDRSREAIENDPANLNATLDEKGSIVGEIKDDELPDINRANWISKRTMELRGRMSFRNAETQAKREWDNRNS